MALSLSWRIFMSMAKDRFHDDFYDGSGSHGASHSMA